MKNFYSRSSTIALRLEFLIISSKYFSQCTYVFPQPFSTHKHTYPQSLYNLQFIVTKHILVEKEIKLYFPCFHSPLCSISCYSCFIFFVFFFSLFDLVHAIERTRLYALNHGLSRLAAKHTPIYSASPPHR